jgi:hypothetical protein
VTGQLIVCPDTGRSGNRIGTEPREGNRQILNIMKGRVMQRTTVLKLSLILHGCGASHLISLRSQPTGATIINTDGTVVGQTPMDTTVGTLLPGNYMYDGRFNTEGRVTFRHAGCEDSTASFMEQSAPPLISTSLQCAQPAPPAPAGPWTNLRNWRHLRERMTRDDVRALLGEPPRITRDHGTEIWFYPTRVDGTLTVESQRTVTSGGSAQTQQETRGGSVTFEGAYVSGWNEPPAF